VGRYLPPYQNCVLVEIKGRLNRWNVCCCSVQNLFLFPSSGPECEYTGL
jgi:hypothetical protein